nr:MAG TPA: hypothetical protein [Caudoviricetes sp.]
MLITLPFILYILLNKHVKHSDKEDMHRRHSSCLHAQNGTL